MDELVVTGAFMETVGRGDGPEVVVFLSVQKPDGSPEILSLPDPKDASAAWPIEVFTGLTAMFGGASFPCRIVEVEFPYYPPTGYVSFTVELQWANELGRLSSLGVAALGVIVTSGGARGQGVLASAGAATPQPWVANRQPSKPDR